ncbi:MAG: hypothetical protein U0795_13615 [Pirellulales bacterium]
MNVWKRICVCAVVVAVQVSLVGVAAGQIRAGAAKRIITPDPLLPVSGGMGPTEPAREKRGELTARAVVVAHANSKLALVSVDLLGFPSVLGDRARQLVPNIPADNILIGATHTHSAPDCYAFPDGQGGHAGDLAYMERVVQAVAEAIREADQRLVPVQLKAATGAIQGKVAYNYYAPELYDRRASVLQFVTPSNETVATLINFAIHPEVIGSEQGICSPDLIGPLCDRLEQELGGMGIFLNSAQGGMITADNRDLERPSDPLRAVWHDVRTWEECQQIGETLADESIQMVRSAPVQSTPNLFVTSRRVKFPVESDAMWGVVTQSPLKYPHDATNRTIEARINLVNLGSVQMVSIPGEALPNIGFFLKRKMAGEHNLLLGLTNDAFGYILTQVDYKSFPRYDYVSRVSLGEMTGEILMKNVLELVHESPAPDRAPEAAAER